MTYIEYRRGYPGDREEPYGDLTDLPSSHPSKKLQRSMDEIEQANGGHYQHALLPRFWTWIRGTWQFWTDGQ